MNKKCIGKVSLVLSAVLALSACGPTSGGGDSGSNEASNNSIEQLQEKYPLVAENEGTPVDGGTIKQAVVSDSGFKGILNPVFYTDGYDADVMKNAMMGAFWSDKEDKLILNNDKAPVKVNIDKDKKLIIYDINPNFKWNTGEPVTTTDIVRTYEVLANQKFIEASQSPRFGKEKRIIEGIVAYNEGKADKISGLKVRDASHMEIQLTEMNPSVYWGGCTVYDFLNAKSIEGVPMDKLMESDAFRKNPPSYGPYVVKDVLNGEKVVYEANKYYYRGEPKVKRLEVEILPTSQVMAAIEAGKYDIIINAPSVSFPQLQELNNVNLIAKVDQYVSYLGFKQGKWDAATNTCITNPDAKMNDVNLKHAMGYAIDNKAIGDKFYHGLSFPAKNMITPTAKSIQNPEVKGFNLDIEKANKLLDEGGYKDVDGDGIREDKNGKPLKINFAMMSGGETAEPLSQYYMQQWEKIGLDVGLVDGRLLEFNDFYDRIQKDDPAIDCYTAAWGLGSDPSPQEVWSAKSPFNFTRYTSDTLATAMSDISSNKALDDEYRKKAYYNFEQVFENEAPAIPMSNRVKIIPVNKRVKYFSEKTGDNEFDYSNIELTAEKPVVNN